MTARDAYLPDLDDANLPPTDMSLTDFATREGARALEPNERTILAKESILDYISDFQDALMEALPVNDEVITRETGIMIRSLESICEYLEMDSLPYVRLAASQLQHGIMRMNTMSELPQYSLRSSFFFHVFFILHSLFECILSLADTFTGFRFPRTL